MSRRLHPSLADYIVIALSPALIMLLVGSLVFFLIEVFYQGAYDSRLSFIMAMFVMAAVLVARISIEQSRGYAMLFAIPLAIVTAIATIRFVEFTGPLKSFSPVINLGLIGLIWWCSDRLTWDSTVIDESKDASGEGLLQTAGLDADATTQNAAADSAAMREQPQLTLWQRFLAYRHRAHSPGVWVIYFSLAALPIFGFGHWFIPGDDLGSRRYVFKLLVVYVASALGLLLTTSFLNLRRYLRQRRLEMPLEMAGTWIGTGAAMIVALLLICTLLPRRNPEYSVTQIPMFAGSPTDLWTTEHAVGNEGQEDPEKADRPGEKKPDSGPQGDASPQQSGGQSQDGDSQDKKSPGKQPQGSQSQSDSQPNQSGNSQGQSGKGSKGPQSKSPGNSGGKKPEGTDHQPTDSQSEPQSPESGNETRPSDDKKGKGKSGAKKSGQDPKTKSESDQGEQSPQKGNDGQQRRDEQPTQPKNDPRKRTEVKQQSPQKSDDGKSQHEIKQQEPPQESSSPPESTSKFDPSKIASALGATIGQLLKLLYWVIALAIVGYFTWKYWRQIREALANFWKSLREFWESLFGRKPVADLDPTSAVEVAPPPISFAAFHDPFLTGMAQSKPPVEVIRYSFEAFEAWAREHGCARGPEQTPQEFVQLVGTHQVAVARDAATLAEMYNRCAYARDLGQRLSIEPLRSLWQHMRESIAA